MSAAREQREAEWLTVEQVAERFSLSTHAIYRRIRSGAWSAFVDDERPVRVSMSGLDAWLLNGGDNQRKPKDHTRSMKELELRANEYVDAGRKSCDMCGHSGEVIDHCHVCGYVRGWLCYGCNTQEGLRWAEKSRWGEYRKRCAASDRFYASPDHSQEYARGAGLQCGRFGINTESER